jgi:hypothetical protein
MSQNRRINTRSMIAAAGTAHDAEMTINKVGMKSIPMLVSHG